jgi:lipoprotein signal peptidase
VDVETAGKTVFLLAAFLLDQYIKATITSTTTLGLITFQRVANTGASFGFFQGYNAALFVAGTAILLAVYWYREYLPSLATWLIITGGASNLVDRVVYGHVVDYINIGWWPVFNLADAMLSVGVAIVLIDELVIEKVSEDETS